MAVVGLMQEHHSRQGQAKRTAAAKGRPRAMQQTDAILGGVLRAGLKGRAVKATRRPGGWLWKDSLIGNVAFWAKVDAMIAAGLLGTKLGIRITDAFAEHANGFGGKPTVLWPTDKLFALALTHGVTLGTLAGDWPVSRAAETQRIELPFAGLVAVRVRNGTALMTLTSQQETDAEACRHRVARLNAAIADADIRGCPGITLRRLCQVDLRLGGRHYAVGVSNFQQMPKIERNAVRIDGEAVVELDFRASLLSVFLALTTGVLPKGDPYDVAGLPREAVKAWTVMSLAAGKPAGQWSERSAVAGVSIRCADVRRAMLAAYPTLRAISDILPPDLRATLAPNDVGWASGQFLVGVEAAIVANSVDAVLDAGGVPLPIHDCLMVAERWAGVARDAMQAAFIARVGVVPMVS